VLIAVKVLEPYALHLIALFEQPFRQRSHSADKVSLFLLQEFVAKILQTQATEKSEKTAPFA
jgi:hypothetical protein